MITLAFYKGRGQTRWQRISDGAIRLATGGQFSHVELIAGSALHGDIVRCWSASGRDGGVRSRQIWLKPENWDLVELRIDPNEPIKFIQERIGAKYDFVGILLSHVLAIGGHRKGRWFCSEICAAALGVSSPQRVSPQFLFEIVTWGGKPKCGEKCSHLVCSSGSVAS